MIGGVPRYRETRNSMYGTSETVWLLGRQERTRGAVQRTPRVRIRSRFQRKRLASQAEKVPGLLVGCRFLGVVEEASRERGGRRRPQGHADGEHRLDRVVDVPA